MRGEHHEACGRCTESGWPPARRSGRPLDDRAIYLFEIGCPSSGGAFTRGSPPSPPRQHSCEPVTEESGSLLRSCKHIRPCLRTAAAWQVRMRRSGGNDGSVPRKPSPAARTSLYRVRDVSDLSHAIQAKYLDRDTFETKPHTVSGRDALLVTGVVITEKVSWAERIHELVGETVALGNQTAVGVLLIRAHRMAHGHSATASASRPSSRARLTPALGSGSPSARRIPAS